MEIGKHWPMIKAVLDKAHSTNRHCAIATVSEDGTPHVTPIGSLFLRDDCTGFYIESYCQKMADNLKRNNRVCIMGINSGIGYWLKSLFSGRFPSPPGVRLYGTVSELRLGTKDEIEYFQNRVRPFRKLKGHDLLWKNMRHVREIQLQSFEPVHAAKMTQHLWL
ncbi:pyridoxamine-5'-phosphate oxidase-related FMN-binding protein [Citrifermentans bemidjiense Bem]|uniref:Pyridoxamine-5'-phosphate oxidase-related FMN-binding protein n=1 Tax=Citrifermentans bemidjiense (strain ATCC BAA-1014 / DSM 16622 / JCM 12645 / Bem) TaxID=404380 RepID=B5ECB7_CITBB|nr:pyridoxamine 5'-phosphate oxidase family protein [Citrifermentans bemidjiense]ACH37545.1 pyridoxamine-5'-phosphate oxidase-related FMN-binding protein [Citrifermentans bemidjiense Bem]